MNGGENSLDFVCTSIAERSDEDSIAVIVVEHKDVVGSTIGLNGESASQVAEGVAGWLVGIKSRGVYGVSPCGNWSWWSLFGGLFASPLSLLVEMAFGGGK